MIVVGIGLGLGSVLHEEVLDQQRDVVLAVAQRRHVDVDDVEPVVEVLAEPALLDLAARSRFVAAMTRTSTLIGRLEPMRSNSRSWSTRRSFACVASGISPISSRKSVPPLAVSKRPLRSSSRR